MRVVVRCSFSKYLRRFLFSVLMRVRDVSVDPNCFFVVSSVVLQSCARVATCAESFLTSFFQLTFNSKSLGRTVRQFQLFAVTRLSSAHVTGRATDVTVLTQRCPKISPLAGCVREDNGQEGHGPEALGQSGVSTDALTPLRGGGDQNCGSIGFW